MLFADGHCRDRSVMMPPATRALALNVREFTPTKTFVGYISVATQADDLWLGS